jgi:hypothetical protein
MPGNFDLGSDNFDMNAAVAEVGSGLGFDDAAPGLGGDDGLDSLLDGGDDTLQGLDTPPGAGADTLLVADTLPGSDTLPATPAPDAPQPPKTWRKEALDLWGQLPPAVQSEVAKREEDMFRGMEAYKADAAYGKDFRTALQPYMELLQASGINPAQQTAGLMQAHITLATGSPEQKVQFLRQIAADYGVDLAGLSPDAQPFVDPAVQALQSDLNSVKSILQQTQQREQNARLSEMTQKVNAFAADPKNVYFEEVATDVADLLRTKVCNTLEEAYEKAIWANPTTRAKEIARQTAERDTAARSAAAKRAAEAKKAASAVVQTRAKQSSGTAPVGSMDDTMKEILAEINGRHS